MTGVPRGIRTPVLTVKGQCPRPLDDGVLIRLRVLGGDKRDRTADLLHAMQALSQLSYTPSRLRTSKTIQDFSLFLLDARLLLLYPVWQ